MLSKSDDVVNRATFWAFLFRASILAQHLKGSLNFDMLKDQMLKADDSMNSVLQDNKKLVGDNKNLEDRVLALTIEAKGLETHAVNVEALFRS